MKKLLFENFRFGLLCFVLLAGLIFTYSNHFNNPFHFDDDHTIVNNIWIRDIQNIPKFFVDATTTSSLPESQSYRPGLTTLNTIDYWIAAQDPFRIGVNPIYGNNIGLIPFYFHLSIFICFIFQSILLFFLFKKIFQISCNHRWNNYFALFTTAFYSYHTALAETNNYIISRSDGFSTFMVIFAFVLYLYFPLKRKYGIYLIPFILGIMVKETALMFIPILFFYILLFDKQTDFTRIFKKENVNKLFLSIKAIAIPLCLGIIFIFLSELLRSQTFIPGTTSRWDYLITQPFVLVQYFKTFILPTELSADTDWKALNTIFDMRFLMGILFLIGIIWLAILLSKNNLFRPISFGILWFLFALIPTSSIIPLSEVLNDHRIYFPYIGLSLSFSFAFIYLVILKKESFFTHSFFVKISVIILVLGIFIAHAYGTHQRNKVWSTHESLWYDVSIKSPNNGRGLMNYGLSQMQKGDLARAKIYFEKALLLIPNYPLLHINLALLHTMLQDKVTAESYYKKAISIGMYKDQCYYYYGHFLFQEKRYDEATQMLKYSLLENPANTFSRYTLMELFYKTTNWGSLQTLALETLMYLPNDSICLKYIEVAKNKKTKLEIAIETATEYPTAENYITLSIAYYEAEKYLECIEACREAIKLKPNYALAYNNICSAYNELKMYDNAIEACNKAISIQPNYELAKNNLNLAKSRKGK